MSENRDLKKIGQLYQTDKIEHGYLEIYENYLNKLQNKNLTILEIGIADGKSLLMWSDYFKNSKIIGIDIHKINLQEKKLNRGNINVYQGSQSDKKFIDEIIHKSKIESNAIILNGVRKNRLKYYYGKYGYGYGYGYGYNKKDQESS